MNFLINFQSFYIGDYRLCIAPNKFSPYEDRISDLLMQITEHGIMKHIRMLTRLELKLDRIVSGKNVKRNMYDLDITSLKVSDLKYGFLVYVIGIVIGIIGYLAEHFVYQIIVKHKRILYFQQIFYSKSKV